MNDHWRAIRHVAFKAGHRKHRTFLVGRTVADAPQNEYVRDSKGRLVHFSKDGAARRVKVLNAR